VISIITYHRVALVPEEHDPRELATSPQLFEERMAYLARTGHQCVSLVEAVRRWREGEPQPRQGFVLTFDDGYRDLYRNVWPVLDRFGFGATVFLVAGCVGSQSDWEGQTGPSCAPMLSWAEARELARFGFTFGSHTLTHPRLTLLDDKRAWREIRQARVTIEDHLGVKVDLFSYPYGDFNAHIQRMVEESGHIAACGVDRGKWGIFNLWRAECASRESRVSFAFKVSGWYHQLLWLREESLLGGPLVRVLRRLRGTEITHQD